MSHHRALAWLLALALLVTGPACSRRSGGREPARDAGSQADRSPRAARMPDRLGDLPPARTPARAPGRVQPLPVLAGAQRVAAIEHDQHNLIVAAGVGRLALLTGDGEEVAAITGAAAGPGGVQVLEVIDIERDGAAEIVVGRGRDRGSPDASATLTIYRPGALAAGEVIPLPATTRAQLIGAVADPGRPGRLLVGLFDSKYMVTVLSAERSTAGWQVESLGRFRMAWALTAAEVDGDPAAEVVVARVYGDHKDGDGDVLVIDAAGQRDRVPSTRGARAVTAVATAGATYLVYSDGWHQRYRAEALGLVTRAVWRDGAWHADTLANVSGRFSFDRLRTGDVDGDGAIEVICAGNGPALRVPLEPDLDRVAELGEDEAWDAYPVDVDGDGAEEVVILGPQTGHPEQTRGWLWRTLDPTHSGAE